MPHSLIDQFDLLIRRDPARRGLIGSEPEFGPLCPGHLAAAARHLAQHARHVGLVTGFYVAKGNPPAAETDGPPGALLLAKALQTAGIQTVLLTDRFCLKAVSAAAEAVDFSTEQILVYRHHSAQWLVDFFERGPGQTLTHLIAVERAGPSHTHESFLSQNRQTPAPSEQFAAAAPVESHNRCHDMRGRMIDAHTADMHRLFDELHRYCPQAKSIGIGDGANEIGMGSIPWEDLVRRLDSPHAGRVVCRVPTNWNIVAGTSNWGAYALAAATLLLLERTDIISTWDGTHQSNVIKQMVARGPAVDGVTLRQEPTVDGLPLVTYIQPWEGIRRLLGFEE